MSLKERIEEFRRESIRKIPEDARKVMQKATEGLVNSGIEENIPKVGSKAYDFTLQNYDGSEITLYEETTKGPVVLSFYRGGWCPVCNLELNYLQSKLSDFQNYGAKLIAVSPELPEYANETVERHNIEFPVLYDTDNKVAVKYGLVFKMPDDLVEIYEKFGLDVAKHNGNEKYEIPIPATFVVDRKLTLRYVFCKADYNQRAEPDDIIKVLKKL